MFGWLTTRSTPLCTYAPQTVVSRRVMHMTSHQLLHWLPSLGNLLYLHAAPALIDTDNVSRGLLVAQRSSAPLLDTCWLVAVSVVTDDGPREWCECLDRYGRLRARLHLLPDTDYLAWDALTSSDEAGSVPPVPRATLPCWTDNARVVNFHLRELAGLLLFEQHAAASLSSLSSLMAARIAYTESAALV